ncbi:MAG: hypothetical protein SFV81_11000 [Pirellulaceae bacterium]|nr:hypothetical protein [Pirellulaceae bacterium]
MEAQAKIADLEKKLAALPQGQFDWELHNELRHWYGAIDVARSMKHVEVILKNRPGDEYMKQVLGGKNPDPKQAVSALTETAKRYPKLLNLTAACWLWGGELEVDPKAAEAMLRRVASVQGAEPYYRMNAQELLSARFPKKAAAGGDKAKRVARAPKGMEKMPGPWADRSDLTIWPNQTSNANNDIWLAENHDKIRLMRPRVLLITSPTNTPTNKLQTSHVN